MRDCGLSPATAANHDRSLQQLFKWLSDDGEIERFHRTMRAEFDTRRVFSSLRTAQQALDEWVDYYKHPATAPVP